MLALQRFGRWLVRVWKSGTWGKVGILFASLALIGVLMPRTPTAALPAVTPTPVPLAQVSVAAPTSAPPTARPNPAAAPRPTRAPAATAIPRPTRAPTQIPPSITPTPNHTLAVGAAVNVRFGPNAAFDKVRTLDAAEPVTFEAKKIFENVLWYKIRTSLGETGWISSEVAAIDGGLEASLPDTTESFTLPTAVPEPAAIPKPTAALAAVAPRANPLAGGECPASHPVKGNANSGIYHTPSSRYYSRTKAEECFATGQDAANAGYRAPKQ